MKFEEGGSRIVSFLENYTPGELVCHKRAVRENGVKTYTSNYGIVVNQISRDLVEVLIDGNIDTFYGSDTTIHSWIFRVADTCGEKNEPASGSR